ncbi:MAG: hypothetical protein CVU18_04400 [Betaproteobacteria bacterium HGW-Betaproteobacteria-12]|nr:MAG: hypothetical protein CVU18_04400 [Betaproteobacteria bacterium HGW-Betaproteobacteria-12]
MPHSKLPLLAYDLQSFAAQFTPDNQGRYQLLIDKFSALLPEISSSLYEKLEPDDRHRFLMWFVKRWANIDSVSQTELTEYMAVIYRVKSEQCPEIVLNDKTYKLMDLGIQGYKAKLATYNWMLGIHDFYYDQYQHGQFRVHPGDVIIDAGAFVGDTPILFDRVTDGDCTIHAFEVLDENISLFKFNLELNNIKSNVIINRVALGATSGTHAYVKAHALQGATSIFGDSSGEAIEVITIDDYVDSQAISKVNLIKMDIEGAERLALQGALKTIKRFRPRLAICVYHLWDDVFEIPKLIAATGVEYKFAFKWVQLLNGWEAVLLATPAEA